MTVNIYITSYIVYGLLTAIGLSSIILRHLALHHHHYRRGRPYRRFTLLSNIFLYTAYTLGIVGFMMELYNVTESENILNEHREDEAEAERLMYRPSILKMDYVAVILEACFFWGVKAAFLSLYYGVYKDSGIEIGEASVRVGGDGAWAGTGAGPEGTGIEVRKGWWRVLRTRWGWVWRWRERGIPCKVVMAVSITYIAATFLGNFTMRVFYCQPVHSVWSRGKDSCIPAFYMPVVIFMWITNVSTDIMIMTLGFIILARLQITRREKIALFFVFGLGFITVFASTVKFAVQLKILQSPTVNTRRQIIYVNYWMALEFNASVVAFCAPAFRGWFSRRKRRSRAVSAEMQSGSGGGFVFGSGSSGVRMSSMGSGTSDGRVGVTGRRGGGEEGDSMTELNHESADIAVGGLRLVELGRTETEIETGIKAFEVEAGLGRS